MSNNYVEKNDGYLTFSMIEMFEECPFLYYLKFVDKSIVEARNTNFVIGNAIEDKLYNTEQFEELWKVVKQKPKEGELLTSEAYKIAACYEAAQRHPIFRTEKENRCKTISIEYKGKKLKGELDELNIKERLITDNKTTDGIKSLKKFLAKYKIKMSFYQYLVEKTEGVLCEARLQIFIKPSNMTSDVARFFSIRWTKEELLAVRGQVIEKIDNFIEKTKFDMYPPVGLPQCFGCEGYDYCPHAIQKVDLTEEDFNEFFL